MSWEHTRYKARAAKPPAGRVYASAYDDRNRSETSWEGFNSKLPDPTAARFLTAASPK